MMSLEHRPAEIANLLNPAFCGEVIRRCVRSYQRSSGKHFPYPLCYLILPIVLHKKTRDYINPLGREHLNVWIHRNQDVRIGFPDRARDLIPITNETIIFLQKTGSLGIDDDAKLYVKNYSPQRITDDNNDEIHDCFRKSEIVGKWFSSAGNPSTIFTMWGVRP